MAKIPAFQFYPADWLKDIAVQSLEYRDQGVWFAIICRMHEAEKRGVLSLNNVAISDEKLAKILGISRTIFKKILKNILDSGVASREDETGALMNRRMVRDDRLRSVRAAVGSIGGKESARRRAEKNPQSEENFGQAKKTAKSSSSSSSSSSIQKQKTNPIALTAARQGQGQGQGPNGSAPGSLTSPAEGDQAERPNGAIRGAADSGPAHQAQSVHKAKQGISGLPAPRKGGGGETIGGKSRNAASNAVGGGVGHQVNGRNGQKPDLRFEPLKLDVIAFWDGQNPEGPKCPWTRNEDRAEADLLKAYPDAGLKLLHQCLVNRARSGVGRPIAPHKWLRRLMEYRDGPLDQRGHEEKARRTI
ncbi:MAG: hypothetical protein WBQ94_04460 [Terracidiphilus sp.]